MHPYRSHSCNDLRPELVGERVRLSGWVHRKRDHGGLLFIDLRDHYGITQCVVETGGEGFAEIEAVRQESVVTIEGPVAARSDDTVNTDLPTGHVEIRIEEMIVLSSSDELPMPVFGEHDYPEEIRLKYRYLDLRREKVHANMVLRSKIISSIRRRMTEAGFGEYQTPILTASSPEGARDFLVPSRLHPGKFYALPQAPQQFKQLIMMAGFDRYFQIAPCFRDEDARADRSPGEFYQLDVEMSFVTQEDVFVAIEPVLTSLFEEFSNWKRREPFPRISYADSMLNYGNDKPDLRNPLKILDVTEVFRGSNFGIFAKAIEKGAVVRAIPAPNSGDRARSFFDKMNDWARSQGAPGMGYIILVDSGGKGPIANNLGAERIAQLKEVTGLGDGDGVFFACDKPSGAAQLAGLARTKVGEDLGLITGDSYEFCWIVDYPMFEYDEKEKKLDFSHNPFSMPQGGLEALVSKDPLEIISYQYDLVCNGVELSSGAIRNHLPELMIKAFEIVGYSREDVERDFAGLFNAFRFGAPPHGGIAPGIDRIVMLLANEPNLREVIMFPMNQMAEDLMMNAPAQASNRHLRELHIKTVLPDK